MENQTNRIIITCPHCGYQYTLEEVVYPSDVFGKPTNIIRDPRGKLIYWDYKSEDDTPTFKESFICDHCEKSFKVNLKLTATTEKEEDELDFTNQSVSLF